MDQSSVWCCEHLCCPDASETNCGCVQVWESGFISIPHTFDVSDLQPKLAQLMSGDVSPGMASPGTQATNSLQPQDRIFSTQPDDIVNEATSDFSMLAEATDFGAGNGSSLGNGSFPRRSATSRDTAAASAYLGCPRQLSLRRAALPRGAIRMWHCPTMRVVLR
jgi:hypothetical protein